MQVNLRMEFKSLEELDAGIIEPYYNKVIDEEKYLHFYDGVIPECTYFDIYAKVLEGPVPWPIPVEFHATPIPGTLLLLGSGLIGLLGIRRKRRS